MPSYLTVFYFILINNFPQFKSAHIFALRLYSKVVKYLFYLHFLTCSYTTKMRYMYTIHCSMHQGLIIHRVSNPELEYFLPYLNLVMKINETALMRNKDTEQLHVNHAADQRHCFGYILFVVAHLIKCFRDTVCL